MAGNVAPNIIDNGLVLYLDAANTKSYPTTGTTWTDLSRSVNNGTLINGPTFSSLNGGSIVFDAIDDYLQVNSFNIPINFTLSVWCLIDYTNSDTFGRIIENGLNNYFTLCINKNSSINKYSFQLFDGNLYLTSNTNVSQNYTNIVIVNTNTLGTNSTSIFINGVLDNSNSKGGTFGSNQTLYIGANPSSISNTGLKGNISNVLIYNRALVATEVLQNYNSTKSRFGL